MIDEHRFNSEWFGAPVGIVRDPAFFSQPDAEVRAALSRWAWAEFRCAPGVAQRRRLASFGFFLADTQVHFRLGLSALEPTPSLEGLTLRWADQAPFEVPSTGIAAFHHERYQHVPGVTAARLNERYARWAKNLVSSSPSTCLQVEVGGEPQGWFLSGPQGKKLQLTLAMTAEGAKISGLHLYLAAGVAYAKKGFSLGEASFSVHNTPVLNIYAKLGARFVSTEDAWLWTGTA